METGYICPMKFSPFLLALMLSATTGANAKDYLQEIAEKSCKCIEERVGTSGVDNADLEALTMQMGLCRIEVAQPHAKKLKKDHGIDFGQIERDGEKLGTVIGLRMATICPQTLLRMTQASTEAEAETAEISMKSFEGTVVSVNEDQFVVFNIDDVQGKRYRFLWLDHFRSDLGVEDNFRNLVGTKVHVSYQEVEFFEPKLREYRIFNVVRAMNRY